jgi:hypothetical protein
MNEDVDEIKDYHDSRYISAIEGVWHIFHFFMHDQSPSVIRLDTHLDGENTIVFKDDDKVNSIKNKNNKSKLTAWFHLNTHESDANIHLYHDIPKFYVWKNDKKCWQKRKRDKISDMIGRMYFIAPSETEKFSLRILLLNTPGAKSFEHLRTFENAVYPTFHACAVAKGLLQNDDTWNATLKEAHEVTTDFNSE